jgi:hypothetical protein
MTNDHICRRTYYFKHILDAERHIWYSTSYSNNPSKKCNANVDFPFSTSIEGKYSVRVFIFLLLLEQSYEGDTANSRERKPCMPGRNGTLQAQGVVQYEAMAGKTS